ncbi:MAG TPA: alpha/beta fold hydrolase [Pseudonocardia sp.]
MRFVLVHGGMHGAWCWAYVLEALKERGHGVVAPDLPGHGAKSGEPSSLKSYQDTLVQIIEPGDVLVGHSLGGAAITLAADARAEDIHCLIYIAAPIPAEGQTLAEVIPPLGDTGAIVSDQGSYWLSDVDAAKRFFYHDCGEADIFWAYRNIRPQTMSVLGEEMHVSRFWAGTTPRREYIVCLDDRTGILPEIEVYLKRLGVTTAHPFWASHSPMISRPEDLASLLVGIADGLP